MDAAVTTVLVSAAVVIVPTATTFIVTWLRAKTAALGVVRQAVTEVEQFASSRPEAITGPEKRELALEKIRRDPRTDIDDERATRLIERVLPEVRAETESSEHPTQRNEIWPPAPAQRLEESASGLPTPPRRR